MKHSFFFTVVLVALLCGCSSVYVTRDYDDSTDYSSLETYAWQHVEQPQTGIARIDNDLMDERIRMAVNATLDAKGFKRTDKESADFLVAYFVEYKQRIGGSTIGLGLGTGGYGYYGGLGYNTTISDYDEGHLTIDIIDAKNGKNIWRGVGSRTTYEGSNPAKTTKIINDAISRILAKFPPQS